MGNFTKCKLSELAECAGSVSDVFEVVFVTAVIILLIRALFSSVGGDD